MKFTLSFLQQNPNNWNSSSDQDTKYALSLIKQRKKQGDVVDLDCKGKVCPLIVKTLTVNNNNNENL